MRKEESERTKDCEKNCREDVIEEFYDLMIEKVLNYIGAE